MPWLLRWLRRLLDPEDRSWPEGSLRAQLESFRTKTFIRAGTNGASPIADLPRPRTE
jgi:hypothetical protein